MDQAMAENTAENVRNWLQMHVNAAEIYQAQGTPVHGLGYVEKFLLDHGTVYPNRIDLPEGVSYGRAKECFGNAFFLATIDDNLFTYVEGYAYTPGLIPCPHAWVVDADGNVVDPTWRDGGDECGFCDGEGTIFINVCIEHDDDIDLCGCDEEEVGYYEGEERDCRYCEGKGKSDHPHPSREGTEYLGIPVEKEKLIETVLRKGTYGVLDDLEFVRSIAETG